MPELPEVETVRAGLTQLLGTRAVVAEARVHRRDLRRPVPARFAQALRGQALQRVDRRAKVLIWRFASVSMINHLGMTGSWRLAGPGERWRHDHLELALADGRRLVYHDPRRFGLVDLVPAGSEGTHPCLIRLGPEPLDEQAFTPAVLAAACRGRRAPIKAALMDAAVVAGVGNIYANEALFRARIRPTTPAGRIATRRLAGLVGAVRSTLHDAIAAGGSTIRDFRQAGGSGGYFQASFAVYGRGGAPCVSCGRPLKQAVVAQRATVWCGHCQR